MWLEKVRIIEQHSNKQLVCFCSNDENGNWKVTKKWTYDWISTIAILKDLKKSVNGHSTRDFSNDLLIRG